MIFFNKLSKKQTNKQAKNQIKLKSNQNRNSFDNFCFDLIFNDLYIKK